MNQETIPDNNLPVYLQKYDVDILDDEKKSAGKFVYTTVGAIPSNEKEKRVWQLNLTGYLKPDVETYNIVYDFSKVDYKYKEQISFENIVSGTFNICGQVLDASKTIGFNYFYSDIDLKLTIKLETSKLDLRLKKEVLFSYQLNLDDSSTCKNLVSYHLQKGEVINAVANLSSGSFETYYFTINDKCYPSVWLNPEENDPPNWRFAYPNIVTNDDAAEIRIANTGILDDSGDPANIVDILAFTPSLDAETKCYNRLNDNVLQACFKVSNVSSSNSTFDVQISSSTCPSSLPPYQLKTGDTIQAVATIASTSNSDKEFYKGVYFTINGICYNTIWLNPDEANIPSNYRYAYPNAVMENFVEIIIVDSAFLDDPSNSNSIVNLSFNKANPKKCYPAVPGITDLCFTVSNISPSNRTFDVSIDSELDD